MQFFLILLFGAACIRLPFPFFVLFTEKKEKHLT